MISLRKLQCLVQCAAKELDSCCPHWHRSLSRKPPQHMIELTYRLYDITGGPVHPVVYDGLLVKVQLIINRGDCYIEGSEERAEEICNLYMRLWMRQIARRNNWRV